MTRLAITLIASLISTPLAAQWLKQPTAGIPRTADGKPDLAAPAPRTPDGKPDLSGLWGMNPGKYSGNIVADLKPEEVQPQADALFKRRREELGKDDPSNLLCLPQGPRSNLFAPLMNKIVQTPTLMVILSEDLTYRQIFLDGRELPKDPNPSFMGYSVGHWEGDTLVVESTGFNDRTWLDFGGHPHTEALRITERFRRRDFGHIDIEETLDDPTLYGKSWTVSIKADLAADTEMLEYVCNENERDRQHLVGKASDDFKNAVAVAPEVLSKYVGTYEFHLPENPVTAVLLNITTSDGKLLVNGRPVVPLSDTIFSAGGNRLEFVTNGQGVVTHIETQAAKGTLKAIRKN